MPQFSEDDFINHCVVEALVFRSIKEQQEAERKRQIDEWKSRPLGSDF